MPHLRLVGSERDVTPGPARWVEVAIGWGACPLRVVHLPVPARFVVADALPEGTQGFVAPLAELGLTGGDVVVTRPKLSPDGVAHARVPAAARYAWFTLPSGRTYGKVDGERAGIVTRDEGGALLFELQLGRRCRFDLGTLTIEVAAIEEPDAAHPAEWWRRWQWALLVASLILNAIVITALLRG